MTTIPQPIKLTYSRAIDFLQKANSPDYYWITRPVFAFLITRMIIFLGAYLAEIAIPGVAGDGYYHANPSNLWLDVWARWDSAFYLNIAEYGYYFELGKQSSVAFFPLYPLLMDLMSPIMGSMLAAGVFVSNASLLGALIFLYKLTELEFEDAAVATRAVFYIAAFPTSFFFTAVYTESTFLLMAIATMYFARKREWGWATLFGILTSSSRIVGVVMWGVVGLEWLRAHGWTLTTIHTKDAWLNMLKGLRRDWLNLGIICLIPLGLLSYMVFLNHYFEDPVAFSTTQSAWGREIVGPWAVVWRDLTGFLQGDFLTGQIWYHVAIDLTAFFVVLAISGFVWRRLGASYALYGMISILVPASSGSGSLSRYALVVFPMFMMLAFWGRYTVVDRFITITFSVLLGILTTVFVNWVFVA